ncbi:MAG: hypothetical protein AB8F95_06145 [Bacteroidia bacterium]
MRIHYFIICCLIFAACGGQSTTDSTESTDPKTPKITIEGADENNPPSEEAGLFMVDDDKERFPYIQPLNDSTLKMAAYTVRFEMSHQYPLRPLVPERTPWFNEVHSTENQGVFISYVISGRRLMLSEPNIRVDYINKENPYYGTVDSAVLSIKTFFLTHPDAKVLKPQTTLKTRQGRDFEVVEVYAKRDTIYSPKFQAFGYMDYNDDYIVSIHLTALDEFEFRDALPFYYRLLRGFKAVDR